MIIMLYSIELCAVEKSLRRGESLCSEGFFCIEEFRRLEDAGERFGVGIWNMLNFICLFLFHFLGCDSDGSCESVIIYYIYI